MGLRGDIKSWHVGSLDLDTFTLDQTGAAAILIAGRMLAMHCIERRC